jgi:hypothetical protein
MGVSSRQLAVSGKRLRALPRLGGEPLYRLAGLSGGSKRLPRTFHDVFLPPRAFQAFPGEPARRSLPESERRGKVGSTITPAAEAL